MRNKENDRSVIELARQIVNACASDALDDVEDVAAKMLDDCSDDAERKEIRRTLKFVHALVRFVNCLRRKRTGIPASRVRTPPPVLGLSGKNLKYPAKKALRAFMLDCVRHYRASTGLRESEIGWFALRDPAFISQIAAGRNVKIKTFVDLMAWLDGLWPVPLKTLAQYRQATLGNEQWPNSRFKYPHLHGLMLDSAQRFQDLTGMPPSEIGRRAIGDAAFFGQSRRRNYHLKTFESVMAFLDAAWPSGAGEADSADSTATP